jgi:hypothetical protein
MLEFKRYATSPESEAETPPVEAPAVPRTGEKTGCPVLGSIEPSPR